MNIPTEVVLQRVHDERIRQDRRWGGPAHDDTHTLDDWAEFIDERTDELVVIAEAWEDQDEIDQPGDVARVRKLFIEIAALAVAALESIDRTTPIP